MPKQTQKTLEYGLKLLSLSLQSTQRATHIALDAVVYCKECIRWDTLNGDCGLHSIDGNYFTTHSYDYCSRGKRRE